jgi:transposase
MSKIKYGVGIDVSKKTLACTIGATDTDQSIHIIARSSFANTSEGFAALMKWVASHRRQPEVPLLWLMEATGVYYEALAYYLHEQQQQLSVLLPTLVKNYAKSTSVKTKTDRSDAALLCRLALERRHKPWQPASPLMRQLKALARERCGLIEERTAARNRRHALEHGVDASAAQLERINERLDLLKRQIKQIEQQINELVDEDPELKRRIDSATSIKGVSLMTVVALLAEYDGFAQARSIKGVVSYAGLDIVESQSGEHSGATHISRRGNARVRRLLYMPALAAIRYDGPIRSFYLKQCQKTPRAKKPAVVAVARKLLRLVYVLFTKNVLFDPERFGYHNAELKVTA